MTTWQIVLTVINGDLRGRAFIFETPMRCVIGRASDCEISLAKTEDFAGISRHHCALDIQPPHVSVRDLGSLNGTYVNDQRIGGRNRHMSPEECSAHEYVARELNNDDVLRVGDISFRVSVIEPALVSSQVQCAPIEFV